MERKRQRQIKQEQQVKSKLFFKQILQPFYRDSIQGKIKSNSILSKTTKSLLDAYGYTADPDLPLWLNIQNRFASMSPLEYFNRPSNMAFHNLCSIKSPPSGIGSTLGLGLKFCIQAKRPPKDLKYSCDRFAKDVRTRFLFGGIPMNDTPKKIYVKSPFWTPEMMVDHMENRLSNFSDRINSISGRLYQTIKPCTNLTALQQSHISLLRNNRDFVILMCDKNLGPAIMERDIYIQNVLNEHLLDSNTYMNLTKEEGIRELEMLKASLNSTLIEHRLSLSPNETSYFSRSLALSKRIPQFYGMPKVHKNKTPIPFRPVISQCGSLSAIISTFIDYLLQPLTASIPSYIKDSTDLLNTIDALPRLPYNARLFTSDATSMYTNIDPTEGIPVLRKYLEEYGNESHTNIDIDLVCFLTELVMTKNVFQFGDTWWKQLIGTAMGTPCACIYATVFFAYFERKYILTKYRSNFLLYKRQIDDIFGIWVDNPEHPSAWEDFKMDLNNYCKLDWNTEELSSTVDFLDLTLWIDSDGKVQYKTYQKPMNLFLYIPAHSSHPPGLIKSLIFGLTRTYYRQNSNHSDFTNQVQLLFDRLLARGHAKEDIAPIFQAAIEKLNSTQRQFGASIFTHHDNTSDFRTDAPLPGTPIYFHLPYHPKSISRAEIQKAYRDICECPDELGESFQKMTNEETGGTMRINKLTVAYSRSQNLRDALFPTTLQDFNDCKVSQFLP